MIALILGISTLTLNIAIACWLSTTGDSKKPASISLTQLFKPPPYFIVNAVGLYFICIFLITNPAFFKNFFINISDGKNYGDVFFVFLIFTP